MTAVRRIAILLLIAIALCGALAPKLAPFPWNRMFRDNIDAPPSPRFPIGTDDVGRDRLSRLLYGTSISAVLAPAAALCSIAIALAIAAVGPAYAVSSLTTICLSLPWMFVFILLRAELPLNTSPLASVALTFGLMGIAGWAVPGRVFTVSIQEIRQSGWLMQARAAGLSGPRIALAHAWPHIRSVALAQFRILIPSYILSEASLGLLGLGVPEPLPSWGNLLRDLQHPAMVRANPWVLAPLGLLIIVMICLETLAPSREAPL